MLTATAMPLPKHQPLNKNSMAKVYESQIDAEEFIRTFRDEPSCLSSLKKKRNDEKSEDPP